jgi:hypothetical protein
MPLFLPDGAEQSKPVDGPQWWTLAHLINWLCGQDENKQKDKKDNAASCLLKHYAELFYHAKLIIEDDVAALQGEIRAAELKSYRRLTQHTLMLAEWFKGRN